MSAGELPSKVNVRRCMRPFDYPLPKFGCEQDY
jgi:hypothetical protein